MRRHRGFLLAVVALVVLSMAACDRGRPGIPDMERVQADLIGRSMTNWKFDSIREFESFEIEETSKYGRIVELRIRMRLRSIAADAFTAEASALVAYRLEEGEWRLVSISETGYREVSASD